MGERLRQLWQEESGQGATEYAILLAAVVILVVASLAAFRGSIQELIDLTGDYIGMAP